MSDVLIGIAFLAAFFYGCYWLITRVLLFLKRHDL